MGVIAVHETSAMIHVGTLLINRNVPLVLFVVKNEEGNFWYRYLVTSSSARLGKIDWVIITTLPI